MSALPVLTMMKDSKTLRLLAACHVRCKCPADVKKKIDKCLKRGREIVGDVQSMNEQC